VRPPGSPIYYPAGPTLVLPRRTTPSIRAQQLPAQPGAALVVEARSKITELLALIQAAEEHEHPGGIISAHNEEMARSLQQLELQLAEREREAGEREFRLAERERDLAETEALLRHREALLDAAKKNPCSRRGISDEERLALANLKAELDRQEAQIRENREALREREKFVEESESRLFEKVQQQQEKETELEQLQEELKQRESASRPASAQGEATSAKRVFDEFNE
jgi:chromosome segregation ATPase